MVHNAVAYYALSSETWGGDGAVASAVVCRLCVGIDDGLWAAVL